MEPKHEQTTNDASHRRARGAKKPEPNPQAEMKIHKAEDDVLDVIENVESQLGALRNAHEEHRKAMADLSKQKREIEDQAGELESRESELTTREVELAEMRQDFESRELNLIQRASGLEQRESKIASQAELLEQQEAEIETQGKTLEQKIQELDDQLAGLSKRKAELESLESEVKEKIAREDESATKLQSTIAELEEIKSSFGEMSDEYESVNAELAQSRELHETTSAELKATESKLRGREIELRERSHTLEDLAEKAGSFELDLNNARDEYTNLLNDSNEKLAIQEQAIQEMGAQLEIIESQRSQESSESTAVIEELTGRLEKAKDALVKASSEIESMRTANTELGEQSEGRVGEISAELQDSRAKVESLNEQLREIAQSADEELTNERAHVQELESQIETLTQQLVDAGEQRALLQVQLDSKPEIDPEELTSLNNQLSDADEASTKLASKLSQAESELLALSSQIESRDEQIAKGDARVQELEDQSAELFATIEQLNEQLEVLRAAPKIDADEWSTQRRSRLQKMRRILKGDAEKIRLATEALRSRYDQCEQVLTKRAELADAYEAIASAQHKYHNREVRSGVFLGLIGMAAITLVLAATSWFVSGRITPGMYAAKVTMAAASGDSKLSETDMAQWEVYITQLTTDPRFLEVAADRMKRRGISEYAVPGELAKEMESSLDVVSAMPGTIVMEYRGIGDSRSQRVLDTFAVAISSAANNARARRADSALTIIEDEALAGESPLDTRRIETAGMIFGAGMLLTIILGGVLWKRLSAAKAKFEKDSRIEGLFDDSQWEMPA